MDKYISTSEFSTNLPDCPSSLDFNRLLVLLDHAIREADEWHDDSRGGIIEDDPLMDEARQILGLDNEEYKSNFAKKNL